MIRSQPLERTSSLSRGGTLKRGKPKRRPSMAGFWAAVTDNGTAPCALAHLGACDGPLDAHHVYPANRIRHRVAPGLRDRALTDPRNGQPCCRKHHAAIEACRVVCPRPAGLDAFLADFDLHEREAA